jgi:hypothetical protein
MPSQPCLSPQQFQNLLLTQLPVYSDMVLRDVRPADFLAAHINQGLWDAFSGVSQTQDRLRNVWPNVTKKWEAVTETSCTGAPCDPAEHEICWGWERLTYGQERQSWRSPMFCFDQAISATKAKETISYYVSDVLFPATKAISSDYVRKKSLELAGNKLLANATMSSFTGTWSSIGDEELYYTPSAWPTSKLTPEMIKRQIPKMRNLGYFGKWSNAPFFGGYDNFAELVTDDDTAWELDKLATNQRLGDLWRFNMWQAGHEYFQYGMGGQIGNYMVHVDPFPLRFLRRADGRAQRVLPYKNEATTQGIGSEVNDDYLNAQYQISFIWHRQAWTLLTQDLTQLHPTMPFLVRGLNGQWNFAIDNLGQDCEGNAIANYRRNKGFYYADFRYGAKPMYTEWMTAIFHLREPANAYIVAPCAADPGYPTQAYTSACDGCDGPYTWDIADDSQEDGSFVLDANTVTCNDVLVANGAIDAANMAALVIALNADAALGALGTWSGTGTTLTLIDSTCRPVLPWVLS